MYKIEINNNRTLDEIQDEFNEFFPHLKIEFYPMIIEGHNTIMHQNPNISKDIVESYRTNSVTGFLYLHDDLRVEEIKTIMFDNFGLLIDIFQKTDINQWSSKPKAEFQLLREIDFEAT